MRFFSLLLFFVLNGVYGQEFEITHKGPLKENWEFYKSKTTYIDYSTIYLCGRQPNENKYNDAKVNILFIDYTLYGGIIVTANNQTNIENDYVDDYVLKGINYYTIYSKRKENETDYKYWFYIDIDGDNTKGVEVAAIIKKTGKSTCSYDKLEKILFQHVRELQFLPLSNNNKQPTLNNNTQNDKNSSDDNSNTWTVIIGAITAGALLGIRNRRKKRKSLKKKRNSKKKKKLPITFYN
ncbi:hypothetical protein Lupro_07075 [Lutibacter profundi]|uniref:Uncharacterized protein n=1 Tax=Lutibacter profundi TaxID=1622118 RepID=A0A109RNH8_9FLAO|nr:LPXTG cell wall anchor domain-containing protein [Lutibacter profundi]AMC11022.1 hypothetical protein Lupro_07075 [Lutibacter profundi]